MNTPHTPIRSSFRDFLTIVFKRKYQMAIFFVITVCTIVGITFSMVPMYKAAAQIILKTGSRNVYTLAGSTGQRTNNRTIEVSTEIQFLKSRFLTEKVLNNLGPENIYPEEKSNNGELSWFQKGIFQHPALESIKNKIFQQSNVENISKGSPPPSYFEKRILKLQNNLSIRSITDTNIINISFKHNDPKMAAKVVNTYVDIYMDERLKRGRNNKARTFLTDQSLEVKNRLDEAEKDLENFKNENSITDLEQQQRLLLEQISNLREELNSTLSKEIETESRIALITMQLSQTPETIAQGEVTDHNEPLISRLEGMLVELQIEEKQLLSTYTPQSRLVKNVRERISIVENKIKEHENKLIQRSSVGVNSTYQRLKEELLGNQAELETLIVKKGMLIGQLAEFQGDVETLNRMETRLHQLQQSVDLFRENYKLYLARQESSRIEDALDNEKINDVSYMSRAIPPIKPFSPKYKLNILLSILIGGIGGLLLAIIGDYLNDSIETPEDVEKALQLTVLTSVPNIASRKRLDHRKVETSQSGVGIRIP